MVGVGSPVEADPDCLPGVESVGSFDMIGVRICVCSRVSSRMGYTIQLIVDFETRWNIGATK